MIQVVTAISSVRVHCLSSKPKSCFAQFILFLTAGGGAECRVMRLSSLNDDKDDDTY
jgi:hypothetical protein